MNLVEVLRNADHNNGCLCLDIEDKLDIKFDGCGCDTCENTFNVIADLIEKYYFQKPLFEDGEPVNLGDKFIANNGYPCSVTSVGFATGNHFEVNPCAVDEDDKFGYWEDDDVRVKRPTQQDDQDVQPDIWSEVDEYLNLYSENYLQPHGNGVYETVKMVPLDAVDNAMYMLKDFYDEH